MPAKKETSRTRHSKASDNPDTPNATRSRELSCTDNQTGDDSSSVSKTDRSSSNVSSSQSKQGTLDKHIQIGSSPEKQIQTEAESVKKVDIEKSLCAIQSKLDGLASQEYVEKIAKNMLTEVILKDSLVKLQKDMKEHIKEELNKVYKKVDTLKQSVKAMQEKAAEIKDVSTGLEMRMGDIEKENKTLKEENRNLKSRLNEQADRIRLRESDLNDLEQYTRRNSVRIYGIEDSIAKETETETAQKVVEMVQNRLQMAISLGDIDIAHRLGKFVSSANRPVICKFIARSKKLEVIRNRRKLKGSAIVIRDDLTIKNAKRLEQATANESVTSAWSDNGKIIALLQNGTKTVINYKTDLTKPLLEISHF